MTPNKMYCKYAILKINIGKHQLILSSLKKLYALFPPPIINIIPKKIEPIFSKHKTMCNILTIFSIFFISSPHLTEVADAVKFLFSQK